MELRTTRELRRNAQLDKVLSKKPDAPDAAKAQAAQKQAPADRCTLSRQALAYLDQQNQLMQELQERQDRQRSRANDSLSAMESKKQELDMLSRQLDVLEKCQKIAASIIKGDRVPPEDLEYLMNNDPDGYKLAMAMRRPKKDPEDCESVLDEEDRNGGSAEESGDSGEAPSVEASGPSEGGGDTSGPTE